MSNIRARLIKDRVFTYLVLLPGIVVIVPFVVVLYHVIRHGIAVINWQFITTLPRPVGEVGGGVANAIIGTITLILIATIVSVPIGVSAGVYLSEMKKSRLSGLTRIATNLLQSVPSIVIGIAMYSWIVVPLHGFSALAGGIALAVMMLPIIVKSTEETVNLVPVTLKEASMALGAPYYATILRIVLPTSMSGILSGITLAGARVAGETAPLLFTAFGNPYFNFNIAKPVGAMPLLIYEYAKSPYDQWIQIAWGASFILILLVLLLNITVRLIKLAGRSHQ